MLGFYTDTPSHIILCTYLCVMYLSIVICENQIVQYYSNIIFLANMINWIQSPPIISSTRGDHVFRDRFRNDHSWSILKDRRSDLIFVTKKHYVNWLNLHESTSVSQMKRHAFCSKVGT